VKVVLGKFARTGIEAETGADLAVGVRAALAHYTRRLRSKWAPIGPPDFCLGTVQADQADVFELSVGAETEAALRREASRYQVGVDEILSHAVLTYLADKDAALAGPTPFAGPSPDAPLL
jgi:hypothetical protein